MILNVFILAVFLTVAGDYHQNYVLLIYAENIW